MPQIHRMGDIGSGHAPCFLPRANVQGSPNVFANNIPVHRQSDSWAPHCLHGDTRIYILGKGFVSIRKLFDSGVLQGTKTISVTKSEGKFIPVESEITGVYRNGVATEFVQFEHNGYISQVTYDHKIYVKSISGYLEAIEIHNSEKELVKAKTCLVRYEEPQFIYDISVHNEYDEHNFLVESEIFVHNCCPPGPPPIHGGSLAAGSPNVFANNLPMGRLGDPVSCGSVAVGFSPNVFAN